MFDWFYFRTLHEQTDRALADSQAKVRQLESALVDTQDKIGVVDKDKGQLDQEIATLKQDIVALKRNLAQLDQEKDSLLVSVVSY